MNESSGIVVVPLPTNKQFVDLTGKRFSRWLVMSLAGKGGSSYKWNCKCDCGNTSVIFGGNLTRGLSTSCGCFRREKAITDKTIHGFCGRKKIRSEWKCWTKMKERCLNKNDRSYHRYGGRGITVCDSWLESFENFISDMGLKPSPKHSIERMDNNLGYSPDNCRWATAIEQSNNRRDNRIVTFRGFTGTLAQASRVFKIKSSSIRRWAIRNGQ